MQFTLSSFNALNFAAPGRVFYENDVPYSQNEYAAKCAWTGAQMARLAADVIGFQEIWDTSALENAAKIATDITQKNPANAPNNGKPYAVYAPGADGTNHTPKVALATRLPLAAPIESIINFPKGCEVTVPDKGELSTFQRPILKAQIKLGHDVLTVFVAHLKSKRPELLDSENNLDAKARARGTLRSLFMRAAEAAALRQLVIEASFHSNQPVAVLGDLNDGLSAVSTQLIAATSEHRADKPLRDTMLFSAYDIQGMFALRRDVAFSHIHQGMPETLDHILLSEEFLASSKFARGEVVRVDYFNDHLQEPYNRVHSDHGQVRAVLRWDERNALPNNPANAATSTPSAIPATTTTATPVAGAPT